MLISTCLVQMPSTGCFQLYFWGSETVLFCNHFFTCLPWKNWKIFKLANSKIYCIVETVTQAVIHKNIDVLYYKK